MSFDSWMQRFEEWRPVAWPIGVAGTALLVGVFAAWAVLALIRRWGRRNDPALDQLLGEHLRTPLRVLAPIVALLVAFPVLGLPAERTAFLRQILSIAGVTAATWFAVGVVEVSEKYVTRRLDVTGKDAALARSVQTRVRVARNLGVVMIVLLGVATALTTIEPVRQLGTSLLASAGVAGVVIGVAAQRTLATFLAGIQIAFTEPIRIEDIVVVEGERGRVEEITLTYVVVRLWDQRRLVVPITWFIEKPFQNWTRVEDELLGSVDLLLDPSVPVGELRPELDRILEGATGLWDGRTKGLQVTAMNEHSITVQIVVSAADAARLWDLRCRVREEMLEHLRSRPGALVRLAAPPITTAGG